MSLESLGSTLTFHYLSLTGVCMRRENREICSYKSSLTKFDAFRSTNRNYVNHKAERD